MKTKPEAWTVYFPHGLDGSIRRYSRQFLSVEFTLVTGQTNILQWIEAEGKESQLWYSLFGDGVFLHPWESAPALMAENLAFLREKKKVKTPAIFAMSGSDLTRTIDSRVRQYLGWLGGNGRHPEKHTTAECVASELWDLYVSAAQVAGLSMASR